MQIFNLVRTDFNIFDTSHQKLTINNTIREPQTDSNQAWEFDSIGDAVKFMSSEGHKRAMLSMEIDREIFYSTHESANNYTPGNFSVEDEIKLASQLGAAFVLDGKVVHTTNSATFMYVFDTSDTEEARRANSLACRQGINPSPLNFEQLVNNLKTLSEHLGDVANDYTVDFNKALDGIIEQFLSRGGMYVNADKEGVSESIYAMFNGTDGKYTVDDLKTMAVLSFERERLVGSYSSGEFQMGASLGYEAIQIEMAYRAGKLSDEAYATVKSTFGSHVEDMIKKMDDYINNIKSDPFGMKNVTHSPVRPELVYKSIDIMLGALKKADFNQGLREAIKTLDNMHNAMRESQLLDKGINDARYNAQFMGNVDRIKNGDRLQLSSNSFTDYLNRPEWAISGNPYPIYIKV